MGMDMHSDGSVDGWDVTAHEFVQAIRSDQLMSLCTLVVRRHQMFLSDNLESGTSIVHYFSTLRRLGCKMASSSSFEKALSSRSALSKEMFLSPNTASIYLEITFFSS